jgi:hypothetical protein
MIGVVDVGLGVRVARAGERRKEAAGAMKTAFGVFFEGETQPFLSGLRSLRCVRVCDG